MMDQLKWISLLALAMVCALMARAQDAPDRPTAPPVAQAETVHPAWTTFTPQFTPHICPFHDQAPTYDPEEFRCGYVLVPEDRTNPDSRLIKLSVLRIRSSGENPDRRAVIRLTGGPGAPSLGAGRIAAYQSADTRAYRDAADLIFFDQRGIGYSEARFCRAVPRNFQFGISTDDGVDVLSEAFQKCLAEARAQGVAVDAYSTWQNALDVRDIRRALGYQQWTLFGVSYGTELGQAVIGVDEAGTRAAILDSVVPVASTQSGGWGAAAYGFRGALEALSAVCQADADCAREVGSFSDRFIAAFEAYDAEPLIVDGLDHGTFLDGRMVMDGDLAGAAVFQALYANALYPDFPSLLTALETRDETAIKAYIEVLGRRIDHDAGNGMELITNCRGAAVTTPEQEAAMRVDEPQLSQWIESVSWLRLCETAYRIDPDPAMQALITDVPILVAAGSIDPITPPAYGKAILPGLANAQYVEFPHTGHGALFSHFEGCGSEIWLAFLANPNDPLDTSCIADITAPDFQTRLIMTKGPYRLARGLQAGTYPYAAIAMAGILGLTLILLPLGWAARSIQGTQTVSLALARPVSWLGAAVSLGGLAWAVHYTIQTATEHPIALPLGVLPVTGWAVWIAVLGFALTVAALYRGLRSGGFGRQQIGSSIGLVATCLAALSSLIFLISLGLGLF